MQMTSVALLLDFVGGLSWHWLSSFACNRFLGVMLQFYSMVMHDWSKTPPRLLFHNVQSSFWFLAMYCFFVLFQCFSRWLPSVWNYCIGVLYETWVTQHSVMQLSHGKDPPKTKNTEITHPKIQLKPWVPFGYKTRLTPLVATNISNNLQLLEGGPVPFTNAVTRGPPKDGQKIKMCFTGVPSPLLTYFFRSSIYSNPSYNLWLGDGFFTPKPPWELGGQGEMLAAPPSRPPVSWGPRGGWAHCTVQGLEPSQRNMKNKAHEQKVWGN